MFHKRDEQFVVSDFPRKSLLLYTVYLLVT